MKRKPERNSPGDGQNGGAGMILVDAAKIKAFIQRHVWTLEEAAEAFHVSLRTLTRMLNGNGVRPGSVRPVAEKMGIPPSELLANEQLGASLYTNQESQTKPHLEWEVEKRLIR